MQHVTDSPQLFCLRWNNYQSNLTNVFDQLLQSESFVDVTLACDGHSVKAHKMVLSACSPYFQTLFFDNPCQHPIIIMRDIKWPELKAAVEFMYKGEINVLQEQIGPLLKVAESLKIRGLADVNGEQDVAGASPEITSTRTPMKQSPVTVMNGPEWVARDAPPSRDGQSLVIGGGGGGGGGGSASGSSSGGQRPKKRRRPSGERSSVSSPAESAGTEAAEQPASVELSPAPPAPPATPLPATSSAGSANNSGGGGAGGGGVTAEALPINMTTLPPTPQISHATDDLDIKPGIAEMIREEERAKLLESSQAWLGASTSSIAADSYQYQLQSMWQKCWNTNQSLVHHLRFRERGPLKSWRPETMAGAIISVLKEGLSLSQAARKYDIPYPTFVLYANRVHNMLGPSADGGSDLRPKGRGRPQRILLGAWPDEHIRGVIRAVVFRDSHQIKEEPQAYAYPRIHDGVNTVPNVQNFPANNCSNGSDPNAATGAAAAAAVAAVAHGLRQQMCSMVAAAQHASTAHDTNPVASLVNSLALAGHCGTVSLPSNGTPPLSINQMTSMSHMTSMRMASPAGSIQDLRISTAGSSLESPIASPLGLTVSSSMDGALNLGMGANMDVGIGSGMAYKPNHTNFTSPRPENLFQEDIDELVKPMHTSAPWRPKDDMASIKIEPMTECRGE